MVTLAAFLVTSVPSSHAQVLSLPASGSMVGLSSGQHPSVLAGVKVYPESPFRLDFILDKGDIPRSGPQASPERLIKYFLATLTIPEKELWVNLSPYEKDRIVPEAFGQTEMGRDLLAQDYLLKQITASLIYPEGETGRKFWADVYRQAQEKFGTTDIPVDTFNKVWIMPDRAVVYENARAGTAYIVETRLKVMLETDYLATSNNPMPTSQPMNLKAPQGNHLTDDLTKDIAREVIIPILEKEVNEGANFASLRQVYHSLILATWYKKKIREGLLAQAYVDRQKIAGVNINDPKEAEKIWAQYVEAFRKGVYSYIKEEQDPVTLESVSRKYFSGGVGFTDAAMARALQIKEVDAAEIVQNAVPNGVWETLVVNVKPVGEKEGASVDPAMTGKAQIKLSYNRVLRKILGDWGDLTPFSQESVTAFLTGLLVTGNVKKQVLINFLEPYVFSHPEELTIKALNRMLRFYRDDKSTRYFLYYIAVSDRVSPEVKRLAEKYLQFKRAFNLHQVVAKRMKIGRKKVLIVENIKEGQGDELVRVATLAQSFLDYNPEIEVTIVTGRPYLYDHPRVRLVTWLEAAGNGRGWDGLKAPYDVVVDHDDDKQGYSPGLQKALRSSGVAGRAFIYVRSNKIEDNFIFENVRVGGWEYVDRLGLGRVRADSVYETGFRLVSELGLPLRVAEDAPREGALINGTPYLPAEKKWRNMMALTGNKSQDGKFRSPVVLLNPYGGETESKGFGQGVGDEKELKRIIKEMVAKGYKVVLLPNGRRWGTREVAEGLLGALPERVRRNCVVSDEPGADPRAFKYYVGYSDYVLTVEGGMMHLAFNMGKPFGIIIKMGAGPTKWIPHGRSPLQGVIENVGDALRVYQERRVDPAEAGKGGIDLDAGKMDLQVRNSGDAVRFNVDPAMLEQVRNAAGVEPVIIDIHPTDDLRQFFGMKDAVSGQKGVL